MNILLTGATGFLGKEIYNSLIEMGSVDTLGRDSSSNIILDLKDELPVFKEKYNLVIHAAGKAHVVPKTKEETNDFFNVNVTGTKNLLKGLSINPPQSFIFISSVSVYGVSSGLDINEDTPLLAEDAYGLSKIKAEELVIEWGMKNSVKIIIFRLPLIIGENPPGNLKMMQKAMKNGIYFRIGDAQAMRSMVLAKNIAALIPKTVGFSGIYNLTDGRNSMLRDLEDAMASSLGVKIKSIPLPLAKILASVGDFFEKIFNKQLPFSTNKLDKLTNTLTFSDKKARLELAWNPNSVLDFYIK